MDIISKKWRNRQLLRQLMILIKEILIRWKNKLHNNHQLLDLTNLLELKSLLNKPHQVLLEVSKFLKILMDNKQLIKALTLLLVVLPQKLMDLVLEVFKWVDNNPNKLLLLNQINLKPPKHLCQMFKLVQSLLLQEISN